MTKRAPVPDIRRALAERVAQRVAGRGIPRSAVDAAVGRVVASLPADGGEGGGGKQEPTVIAALAARSVHDLGSRVRRDLERDGAVIQEIGLGRAGQHSVVTLRVPASARPALERLAERAGYALSFLSTADGGVLA